MIIHKIKILLSIILFIAAANIYSVNAATFIVSNGNDSGTGSFRQAILDANSSPGSDIIDINSVSLIVLNTYENPAFFFNLPYIQNVTINGNGVTILSTIDSYLTQIRSNTIINDVNFSGFSHGCLHIAIGSITINNCTFNGCTNFNHFIQSGGAILVLSGVLNVLNSRFINCQAVTGAAIGTLTGVSGLDLDSCEFDNNIATSAPFGNAIFLSEASFVTTLTGHFIFSGILDQDISRICAEIPTGCQINFTPVFTHTGSLVIN